MSPLLRRFQSRYDFIRNPAARRRAEHPVPGVRLYAPNLRFVDLDAPGY